MGKILILYDSATGRLTLSTATGPLTEVTLGAETVRFGA